MRSLSSTTAPEALDYLCRRGCFEGRAGDSPPVVLLDLKMPKVNGLTVLKTIKGDPVLKMVPIVMLTSSREERDLVESYALGVNAYVVKPVDFAQFSEASPKARVLLGGAERASAAVRKPPRVHCRDRPT